MEVCKCHAEKDKRKGGMRRITAPCIRRNYGCGKPAFEPEEEIIEKLPKLDLFNVSEIKRPRGGGMEIKFLTGSKQLTKSEKW